MRSIPDATLRTSVATQPEYEGRGLLRALMHWAHARSHARDHVLQAMIGIPYFYR